MDERTLLELDYGKVRADVSSFCVSEEGRAASLLQGPSSDAARIEYLKSLGREWTAYLNAQKADALHSWNPIAQTVKSLAVSGSVLSESAIFDLGTFCRCVKSVRQAVLGAETELGLKNLAALANALPFADIADAESRIFRVINSDGEMRDLPPLRELRAKIHALNANIKRILKNFTSDSRYSAVLESSVPVFRSGRQLLAVKSAHRRSIKGIVHEVSQSGMTVFVEPEEAVRCSNELVQAEYDLNSEIRRILSVLCAELRPFCSAFLQSLTIMQEFDGTLAAAKWGLAHGAVFAQCAREEPLLLLGARHPLLGEAAVPVDVRFMDGRRVLIISGPNAGGKTAALKTIALFAAMNQSGFPIPAREGSRFPVFDDIFADIGDAQSLETSLSTFSGRLKNIARAVRCAEKDSLVLLDEFGSGTDPAEGAAIAMAVLDALIEKGACVLITTHQGAIKNYGYANARCINASVEFDTDTQTPTYRLLMGVPGESRALEVAQKSGLPQSVVQAARNYCQGGRADVSLLIAGLTEKHAAADALLAELSTREAKLADLKTQLDAQSFEIRQAEHELKKMRKREADDFLLQSRKDIANLVRRLKEGELTKEKTKDAARYLDGLKEELAEREAALEKEEETLAREKERIESAPQTKTPAARHKKTKKRVKNAEALKNAVSLAKNTDKDADAAPVKLAAGVEVLYGKSKRRGVIASPSGSGGWNVLFGSIKMTVKERDLTPVPQAEQPAAPSYSVHLAEENQDARPAFELRLLGLRAEDAIKTLEKQLDLCTLHNFKTFSVIHGKGEGILQQAVQDYLSNCPAVESFTFAP
ncbi:MAG: endonuclease MutS2, partial [Treponema sp.]